MTRTNTEQDDILKVGTIVDDRYRIVGLAGRGGNGVVYKAQHIHISRTVALKMLLTSLASDNAEFKRFKQEADSASQLRHPNIVAIYDFGPIGADQFYLAMDFLEGLSLWDQIKQTGPLPLNRFKHIFLQACDALEHAHKNKVVHRDIKPGNLITVERDGDKDFLVIVDFGLVKLMTPGEDQHLTTTGTVMGSPLYMSPEQCRGQPLDGRTDIYSLGCVMYQMLSGRVPLVGPTMMDTISKHLKEEPRPMREINPGLYVPPAVERVILKALRKDPGERQQSMAELRKELTRAFSGAPDVPVTLSGAPKLSDDDLEMQNLTVLGLTQQQLATQLLTSSITATSNRRAKLPSWLYPTIATGVVSAVIIGSLMLVNLTVGSLVIANRHLRPSKSAAHEGSADPAASGASQSSDGPADAGAAVEPIVHQSAADLPTPAANEGATQQATATDTSAADAERSKLLAQEELLEKDAASSFKADNWSGANSYLLQCLKNRENLFGADSPTLVPFVAKLAVCAYKLNDSGNAGKYLTRFRELAGKNPELIVGDAALLSQVSEAIYQVGDSADLRSGEQLLQNATASMAEGSADTIGLSMQYARIQDREGNTQLAEQVLRKCIADSQQMPDLNNLSRTWLAAILKRQGRSDDAAAVENP